MDRGAGMLHRGNLPMGHGGPQAAGGPAHSAPPPGTTGLYHTAIRYPTRVALADALRRLIEAGVRLTGASDHGVSEALYLDDPFNLHDAAQWQDRGVAGRW